MKTKASRSGFSLIELMVTVSIISILVAVAIVSYEEFKMRAYQAGAKVGLGYAATLETTFHEEYGGYSARLDRLGFNMKGVVYHNFGFRIQDDDAISYSKPPPAGKTGCTRMSYWNSCTTAYINSIEWIAQPSACYDLSDPVLASTATKDTFLMEAHAHLKAGACDEKNEELHRIDTWSIDQERRLINYPDRT